MSGTLTDGFSVLAERYLREVQAAGALLPEPPAEADLATRTLRKPLDVESETRAYTEEVVEPIARILGRELSGPAPQTVRAWPADGLQEELRALAEEGQTTDVAATLRNLADVAQLAGEMTRSYQAAFERELRELGTDHEDEQDPVRLAAMREARAVADALARAAIEAAATVIAARPRRRFAGLRRALGLTRREEQGRMLEIERAQDAIARRRFERMECAPTFSPEPGTVDDAALDRIVVDLIQLTNARSRLLGSSRAALSRALASADL